jgi:Fe-S-cluster-containing dehydrogenase component/formate-dependent nitrite reductase membrane component NrfD
MQYGFLIDHRRCIGCHACTVACKAENDVPVASFRTWVKYEEKGRFPAIKRHFAVLRCNHCTKAPCVTICPVNALEKRKDGIVDLDRDACIGCRACMQGCPYDAIYLNEDTGSAEKCHFCAHRVEKQLEPACVIVCPESAIVAGDLHDPTSRIAQMVAMNPTLQRRTEQGTGPNVHYLGVEPTMLKPGRAERPETYIWSDRPPHKRDEWPEEVATDSDVRTVLDAGHKVEWGWHVAAYLVTKGIAAGAAILAPFAAALGLGGFAGDYLPELLALVFTLVTTFLLVHDLARPMLFFRLLTRPNTRSWLVKGGWVLSAFGATTFAILAARFFELDAAADALRWVNVPLGLATAGYTAFLFQQCEGRDLWQGSLVLPHLLVQALLCGAVAFAPFSDTPAQLALIAVAAALLHAAFAVAERMKSHPTENARQGAGFLGTIAIHGVPRAFQSSLVVGAILPAALAMAWWALALPVGVLVAVALCAFAGLYLYEAAFVRAGQLPPLS